MKTSAVMKRIRFFTSIMISWLIISPISVIAWRDYIEEYSSHDFGGGSGIGYIRGSILLTGWNNISHDMTLRIQTTANGKVDAIQLIEVNLTLYRNSVEIQEFNGDNIHSITYLSQFKLCIYYNNNISVIGTVEAEFNVDGAIQTYVFHVQVTYIASHAEWYETYALALIITIITLVGLVIVGLLLYKRKQAKFVV